jgi:hypothetical protein
VLSTGSERKLEQKQDLSLRLGVLRILIMSVSSAVRLAASCSRSAARSSLHNIILIPKIYALALTERTHYIEHCENKKMILFALKIAEIMVNMAETRFSYREASYTRNPQSLSPFASISLTNLLHSDRVKVITLDATSSVSNTPASNIDANLFKLTSILCNSYR